MNARVVAPSTVQAETSLWRMLADVIQLAKPRVTVMVIITGLGGMWLAQRVGAVQAIAWQRAGYMLLGLVLVVSGANALNMAIERDSDRLMDRTKNRPLPARRMALRTAVICGVGWSLLSLPVLALGVNGLSAFLAVVSLVMYVALYTPLKRVSSAALLVGAVPGAMPPLIGWTAATGSIGRPGLALFAVLFFWQLPHFIAIATFRKSEYARAGIITLPAERGDVAARCQGLAYALLLVGISLTLVPLGVGGLVYLGHAVVLGMLFVGVAAWGLSAASITAEGSIRWARTLFFVSLLYLTLLIAALMVG